MTAKRSACRRRALRPRQTPRWARLAGRAASGHTALLAAIAAVALAGPAAAATAGDCAATPTGRASMGLALSGGGARGGAHIGVLQALEELRVPIDCVAGTSVGAVVGGFYASGLSVARIEDIARGIDWNAAFRGNTPRSERTFRRKQDDYLFLADLKAGLRSGAFALPLGLVQGQVIDSTLSRAVFDAYRDRDFDRLPTPFRAVATDITTGDPVALGSGDLALALRASMSVPAVLPPVDIDGRMLVDGGLAMNLPVEVVRSMGADVVIAVDTSSALLERAAMRSVVDVTSQLTTLMTLPATERQRSLLGARDVLLVPVFDARVTFARFSMLDETIAAGYRAVMEQRDALAGYSLDAADYAAHAAAHSRPPSAAPIVGFVKLDNRTEIADSIIEERLGDLPLGAPLDLAALEAAVGRVSGLELFQSARYEVVENEAGATGVEIRVEDRAWGPGHFQAGLRYSSSAATDALFDLSASYLRTGVNPHGGEWRATATLGAEPAAVLDLYQPLGPRGVFFVESLLAYTSTRFNVFAGDRVATSFDVLDAGLELSGGRVLGGAVEIRGGVRAGAGGYRLGIGDPALVPGDDFRRGDAFVRLSVDTLDKLAFPRAGGALGVEWRTSRAGRFSADGDFDQLLLDAAAARTWRRHTVLGTLRYDVTMRGAAPPHRSFRLGGFRDLSGLAAGELAGQNAARLGASYYRRIGNSLRFPMYAGVNVERGNVWQERRSIDFDDAIAAGSLWAGIATPLGPVCIGVGRAEDGRRAVYLSVGGGL